MLLVLQQNRSAITLNQRVDVCCLCCDCRFPRVAPEMADRLHIEGGLGLNILNNSSSKWEVLLEPWPLLVSLSNPINPLAKADRTL